MNDFDLSKSVDDLIHEIFKNKETVSISNKDLLLRIIFNQENNELLKSIKGNKLDLDYAYNKLWDFFIKKYFENNTLQHMNYK